MRGMCLFTFRLSFCIAKVDIYKDAYLNLTPLWCTADDELGSSLRCL